MSSERPKCPECGSTLMREQPPVWWKDKIYWIWTVAISLVVVSGLIAVFAPRDDDWKLLHRFIIFVWSVGPSSWYLWDAGRRAREKRPLSEEEKFFFDVAFKFWGAVVAMLLAIYVGNEIWIKK